MITKFWASPGIHLFQAWGSDKCVADITTLTQHFQVVTVSNHIKQTYTYSFDNGGMCTYTEWVNEVATRHQTCLAASILLDLIDHYQLNKLIFWAWFAIWWAEVKTAERKERCNFLLVRLFPKGIAMLGVKLLSILSVLGDLNAILKHWLTTTDLTRVSFLLTLRLSSCRRHWSPADRPETME